MLFGTSTDSGGAGIAAYRLMKGVQAAGVDAKMRVQFRQRSDPTIVVSSPMRASLRQRAWPKFERRFARGLYRKRPSTIFSPGILPSVRRFIPPGFAPDVIHLHWISDAFLHPRNLRMFRQPIVWTLHDMWAFTGGCHYSGGCDRFAQKCGACPQLASNHPLDLSRLLWHIKQRHYRKANLTIVTPSRWLAQEAQKSTLFRDTRVEVIPNGIDLTIFCPQEKQAARKALDLPSDGPLVLAGADNVAADPRKGFQFLNNAWPMILQKHPSATLAVFGKHRGSQDATNIVSLGVLNDEPSIATAYAAADIFVAPSREDNLPNTVVESLACGTPVVAFEIGGMPDLVVPGQTGYLARPFDVNDLAHGIEQWLTAAPAGAQDLCRKKAERDYALDTNAKRYIALYEELVAKQRS